MSFYSDEQYWYVSETEPQAGRQPTLPDNDDSRDITNRIDHLLQATRKGWTIRGGRRPDPDGNGAIGFITWDRQSHGNVPRLEISPDGTISSWYNWPEPDLPSQDNQNV